MSDHRNRDEGRCISGEGMTSGITKDVVVIGAGGAGLTAAIVAAHQGLDVLVVEKTGVYGGATAWSGGNVWVPGNSLAAQTGLVDDRKSALQYLEAVVGADLDRELMESFLESAPKMIDFFQQNTAVQFEVQQHFSDTHMDLEGAKRTGRCVTPLPYNGRQLGQEFKYLRTPLEQVNAPFGMMIGFNDIQHFQGLGRSLPSFLHVVKMVLGFVLDKVLYSRGTRLTMGNALAARLVRAALDAGVQMWRDTPARELIQADGRVCGVIVDRDGRGERVAARQGVLLASGGFSASEPMRRKYIPFPEQHISLMPDSNTGDGIAMALSVGARMEEGNAHNGDWVVVSVMTRSDGAVTKCLHTVLDRPKPGCIAVNLDGNRFANEAARDMIDAMHQTGSVPAFLICDQRFIKKYGMGLVRPGGLGLKRYIETGYLLTATDLHSLANAMEIDSDALEATVSRFNQFADSGVDEDFGRGAREQERATGDPEHGPNPCLGALRMAPFYAVKIFPGDASTWIGLRIDGSARVLGAHGSPIPGLYASGLDANSLWRGYPPSLGANNTLSLTLGYIAAMEMAK